MSEYSTDTSAKSIKKGLYKILIISLSVIFLLSTLVLSPLYIISTSNAIYLGTVLPDITDLLLDICDIAAYAIGFSVIIYSVYRLTARKATGFIVTYCIAVFLKYTLNIVVTTVFESRFDISYLAWPVLYFLFDIIILLLVFLISNASLKNVRASKIALIPFNRFYSSENPLQASALKVGILLAAVKVVTRLVYDFSYGLPQSIIDALWMLVYYLSDILICFVIYLISLLIFIKLDKKLK